MTGDRDIVARFGGDAKEKTAQEKGTHPILFGTLGAKRAAAGAPSAESELSVWRACRKQRGAHLVCR